MIKYHTQPGIHLIITYRRALDKFLLNFTLYSLHISYFYTTKLIFAVLFLVKVELTEPFVFIKSLHLYK